METAIPLPTEMAAPSAPRRFIRNRSAIIGLVLIVLAVVGAFLAPTLYAGLLPP